MSAPGTIILTSWLPYATAIARGIRQRGGAVDAVFVASPSWSECLRRSRGRRRGVSVALHAGRGYGMAWVKAHWAKLSLGACGTRVLITGDIQSARLLADLQAYGPQFIILGGIGIVGPEILQTARAGVFNAHPGLLPWVRGVGVVGSTVLRGLPVGATSHYVHAGIDTGPIIERRLLRIEGSEQTLEEVEKKADALCVRMLVDLFMEKLERGERPHAESQSSRFPLCRWLTPSERAAAEAMVRTGVLRTRFADWQRFVVDAAAQSLSAEIPWEMPQG